MSHPPMTVVVTPIEQGASTYVRCVVWGTPAGGRYGSLHTAVLAVSSELDVTDPEALIALALTSLSEAVYGS